MKVVHLEIGDENYVEIGDLRFLVLRGAGGGCHTVPATCPHRGGPLHLGGVETGGQFIVCPWHQTRVSMKRLLRDALPTIRSGARVSLVVATTGTGATPHAYTRKTLIDCDAALAGCGKAE